MEILKNIFPFGTQGIDSPDMEESMMTIGITTFENRFDRYFVPLLSAIREYDPDCEIIVPINGEHKRDFNEDYRRRILTFMASRSRVYPVIFPRFRGLAKLWNTIIINATHDDILILNDDITITDPGFMRDIRKSIKKNQGRSFLINKSWSHFVLSRKEIDELGYFDERLLGIGEEDGDMTWRYINRYGRQIANVSMRGIINLSEETLQTKPINIQGHSGSKYSLFNRRFMFAEKYEMSENGIRGMFDQPVVMRDAGPDQYANERFYRIHQDEL